MIRNKTGERGSAVIEFVLSFGVLVIMMAGVFQYGYTFYIYNQLQSGVRAAARYGALKTFRGRSAGCIASNQNAVQNVAVYGSPDKRDGAVPIVRGLTAAHLLVDYHPDSKGVPTVLTVQVNNFTVDAIFSKFTFRGKPYAATPYVGRYAPNECD